MVACVYTGQCSVIKKLILASALQLPKSGLYNSKPCVIYIWEHAKSSLALSECRLLPACLSGTTMFHYDCINANFTIGFS